MGAALGNLDPTPSAIDRDLGKKWSVLESSFKWHASCRHTHPSADALLALLKEEGVKYTDIASITAYTYKAAIDVLGLSGEGKTVHQSKFSMGFVLAVAAKKGSAGLMDFTEADLVDPELRELQRKVSMVLDEDINKEFPARWLGRVVVETKDGRTLTRSVDVVKGDPGWTLTRYVPALISGIKLTFSGMKLSPRLWRLRSMATSKTFLPSRMPCRGYGIWSRRTR